MFEHFKGVIPRMSNPIMSNMFPLCMVCYLGSQETYIIAFLCAEAIKCDLHVFPVEIMSDFELPSVQSFELHFMMLVFTTATFIFHSVCGESTEFWIGGRVQRRWMYQAIYTKECSHCFCAIQFCLCCLGWIKLKYQLEGGEVTAPL